jgi:predicted enzyme related to lactoylglutathione lyase
MAARDRFRCDPVAVGKLPGGWTWRSTMTDPASSAGRRPGGWLDSDSRPGHGTEATTGGTIVDTSVLEMRLVVTAPDYEAALAFYRDTLGLAEIGAFTSPGGRVTILDAGRATLELADPAHAAYVDKVEVGRRVAGHVRVCFQVQDAAATTERALAAGASLIAPPTLTPWRSLNARLDGPAGLQLTLFQEPKS